MRPFGRRFDRSHGSEKPLPRQGLWKRRRGPEDGTEMPLLMDDTPSSTVFGLESILPSQFWGTARGAGEPERRLMLAVLQDALLTLCAHAERPSGKSRRIAEEVRRWFASDSRAHPFAFGAICDVLGLEVSYVRGA